MFPRKNSISTSIFLERSLTSAMADFKPFTAYIVDACRMSSFPSFVLCAHVWPFRRKFQFGKTNLFPIPYSLTSPIFYWSRSFCSILFVLGLHCVYSSLLYECISLGLKRIKLYIWNWIHVSYGTHKGIREIKTIRKCNGLFTEWTTQFLVQTEKYNFLNSTRLQNISSISQATIEPCFREQIDLILVCFLIDFGGSRTAGGKKNGKLSGTLVQGVGSIQFQDFQCLLLVDGQVCIVQHLIKSSRIE